MSQIIKSVEEGTDSCPQEPGHRQLDSDELFLGAKTIIIRHGGERYRLLITRNDKLILQK